MGFVHVDHHRFDDRLAPSAGCLPATQSTTSGRRQAHSLVECGAWLQAHTSLDKTPDCTGVAYVVSYAKDGGGTLRAHVIADREGGGTLYLGRRHETMQPLLNSVLKGSSPPQCINYPRPTLVFIPMVPTRTVIDLSTIFKSPYRLR
jgi:hypothetical protein